MKGKSALFWLGLAAAAGGVLFQTSYEVQELEDKLGSLNRQIMDEQEAIQILKAEWSYLNDPTRLESLASQHLQLQPTEARQFVAMDVVPMRPVPPPDAAKPDAPKPDGIAPLPPMVRLAPTAPGTAVAANGKAAPATGNGNIIPASLPSGMATPAKPAPIKPSALIPGAGKAPALPAAKASPATSPAAAPASAPAIKQVDVAARPAVRPVPQPLAAPASASSTVKPLSARQPAAVVAVPAPPAPVHTPKPTDSIGVLVARLGANR